MPEAVTRVKKQASESERPACEPIAIIGVGCRFPGGVDSPRTFWRLLYDGVDAISEVPKDRWDIDIYYDPNPDAPGKICTRYGGFLNGVDKFAPQFFSISPREALSLDPQQRLLLEVAWEALENANIIPENLYDSPTGVFVGISNSDYVESALGELQNAIIDRMDAYFGTGNSFSAAAGRLSYFLRLTGPNMAIDTACSSSLVALHLACQSLHQNECDLALAGGVNLVLSPTINIVFTKARMLAPDGRCKTFDAAADGYVRGEGCGILVLKKLSKALSDGDSIMALVRGSAINQDGPSSGLTVPSGPSQEAVIRKALETAGLEATAIDYIEAHGTGTYLGDPIEAGALAEVYGRSRTPEKPLYVGSVKTNIGHSESAAGVASVIKTVLALQHRKIPPHLHYNRLNPHIPWNDVPIIVPTEPISWNSSGVRRAGISGFGFSGTNVHVIIEEGPQTLASSPSQASLERPMHLLTLSARSEADLIAMTAGYAQFLRDQPELDYADVCYTANTCRSRFNYRLAVTAASAEAASQDLASFGSEIPKRNIIHGRPDSADRPKIAFLFTGQGGQYINMGKQLYETQPAFRRTMDQCNEILRPYLKTPLLSLLYPEVHTSDGASWQYDQSDIHSTAYTQPALFALEYALAHLWRTWGVNPDVVLGHSVGDYAASCVAGVFDLADGLRLIAERARLIQELPQNGCMAAVFADPERIMPALLPYREQACIATLNGPENVVISGEREAVDAIVRSLKEDGIQSQPLEVSHAFHSHLMDPILDDFERFASQVTFSKAHIEFVSTLYENPAVGKDVASPAYWRDHIRKPVRFAAGVAQLIKQGYQTFIEIGPHPVLLGIARQCLTAEQSRRTSGWHWLPSLHRNREPWQQMLLSLGELFVAGGQIDWHGFERKYRHGRQKVPLPTYPFQRERYWLNMKLDESGNPTPMKITDQQGKIHPLLGSRLPVAGSEALHFQSSIGINNPPILNDHRILGKPFVPGALFLEIALAAGAVHFKSERLILEEALIEEMLVLPEEGQVTLQMKLVPESEYAASFQIFGQRDSGGKESDWIRHCSGRITNSTAPPVEPIETASFTGTLDPTKHAPDNFYFSCQTIGFNYGASFQSIQFIDNRSAGESGEIIGKVRLPEKLLHEATDYHLHPALLDGCIQLAIAAVDQTDTLSLPTRLERLAVFRPHPSQVWVRAKASPTGDVDEEASVVTIHLYDDEGAPVAEIEGVAKKVDRRSLLRALYGDHSKWIYEILWEPHPSSITGKPESAETARNWLILADQAGLGAKLANHLRARGDRCAVVRPSNASGLNDDDIYRIDRLQPQAYQQLLDQLRTEGTFPLHGVVYLWGLDADSTGNPHPKTIEQLQEHICGSALHLTQALVNTSDKGGRPRLWLVTQGAQAVQGVDGSVAADQSALWGLGRVIAMEHPDLRCARIDLDIDESNENVSNLFDSICFSDREDQLAFRQGNRYVARLAHPCQKTDRPLLLLPKGNYKVSISNYGILDSLVLQKGERKTPGPGEVEIQVRAAGLNFRDVLNALGMLKEFSQKYGIEEAAELPFGSECAGNIVAVGEGVEHVKVGDGVIAGLAIGSMATYVTVPVDTLLHKPLDMTFEEATTLPIAFMTAYYGLKTLANLQAGERLLIHAAAGGVGQAAIQLAQQVGAEIFATASEPKWDFLKTQGVTHVMNSRNLHYIEQIKDITAGEGVDVVLNSLAGEFARKNLEVLNSEGRYVELGKLGILSQDEIRAQMPDASYFTFDLLEVAWENPQGIRILLSQIQNDLEAGLIKPLPLKTFPIQDVIKAFRYMAQAKHVGKVVLQIAHDQQTQSDDDTDAVLQYLPNQAEEKNPQAPYIVRSDISYLITGGLGALGLRVAYWLTMMGARHLILTGRSGAESAEAQRAVNLLGKSGAKVRVVKADVSRDEDAAALFAEIEAHSAPLKGIIHAAGVLDDGTILNQTWERFRNVMAPKVGGLWNLHLRSQDMDLDFFIAFSSIASLLGSPGQGNYAAANAYMDGLMHYRRSKGLPGLSINWGPWAEAGMAVRLDDRYQARQSTLGLNPLLPALGLHALETCLNSDSAQAAVMLVDWKQFFQQFPFATEAPLLEAFSPRSSTEVGARVDAELLKKLKAAPANERKKIMLEHLRTELSRILGLNSPQQVEAQHRLLDFGLDSLMAIELISSLEISLGTTLPATVIFNHPTIGAFIDYILEGVLELAPSAPNGPPDQSVI